MQEYKYQLPGAEPEATQADPRLPHLITLLQRSAHSGARRLHLAACRRPSRSRSSAILQLLPSRPCSLCPIQGCLPLGAARNVVSSARGQRSGIQPAGRCGAALLQCRQKVGNIRVPRNLWGSSREAAGEQGWVD